MAALPARRSPCRSGEGPRRHYCSTEHASLVEGYQLAVYDQEARAEAATGGYERELAEYYATVEPRLTFKNWLLHSTDHTRAAWLESA